MSVAVDHFFNSDAEHEELRSGINGWLGSALTGYDTLYLFDTVPQKLVIFPQHVLDVNSLDQ
jgi:hypothetical protein